ncbi:MAG: M1 family peptidase, partial [Flavobacteriaceae bacterium]
TNTIDYAIKDVFEEGAKTIVSLARIGLMPMPLDILVIYNDGSSETFYAPLRMMRGEKENPYPAIKRSVLEDWPWAYPTYEFTIDRPLSDIKGIQIDPSFLMADVHAENNTWQPKN